MKVTVLFALVVLSWNLVCCGAERLVLTVAYCPTYFTGEGAVVDVDPYTGNWTITGKFSLPASFECPILMDPTVTISSKDNLYMDFIDEFGLLLELNIPEISIGRSIKPIGSDLFTGYENMGYSEEEDMIKGLSVTVRRAGMCSNGCFTFGTLNPNSGAYTDLQDIPFKALMDDSHLYDSANNLYYVQGSYDLRDASEQCAPGSADLCLLKINAADGSLMASTYTNYTVEKFQSSHSTSSENTAIAFVEGFSNICHHPYNNYAFATIDLETAQATFSACMDESVSIDMDPWISSFSTDLTLFATGSGDAEAGEAQVVVLDVGTGKAITNTKLDGLGQALRAVSGLYDVWSVDFI
ncbi:hypothetical protein Pelo_7177 [Pelomyxa schiedti]|nr:hypothetical protein Pelo_7177 [Pelomyxa schiedti]